MELNNHSLKRHFTLNNFADDYADGATNFEESVICTLPCELKIFPITKHRPIYLEIMAICGDEANHGILAMLKCHKFPSGFEMLR